MESLPKLAAALMIHSAEWCRPNGNDTSVMNEQTANCAAALRKKTARYKAFTCLYPPAKA